MPQSGTFAPARKDSLDEPLKFYPPALPNAAVLRTIARALLGGPQDLASLRTRWQALWDPTGAAMPDAPSPVGVSAASVSKLLEPVLARYTTYASGDLPPRLRDLIRWLRGTSGLAAVWSQLASKPRPAHWIGTAPGMQPVPVAQSWDIPAITTLSDLAEWLWLSPSQLDWYADPLGRNQRRGSPPLCHYQYRICHKPDGGVRLLALPKRRLKRIQRQILSGILNQVPAHPATHGFCRGRSTQTFAAPHCMRSMLLRFDLRDFFPTVGQARVESLFRVLGYPEPVARQLAGLCTNRVGPAVLACLGAGGSATTARQLYRQPHLPQGAPTSPALANMCAYRLDCRLMGLARSFDLHYTRYADDLAFSGNRRLQRASEFIASQVDLIVRNEGFALQPAKTRRMPDSQRQQLAGLVVNRHPQTTRAEYDRLKAILTNCVRHGPANENRAGHPSFRQHLAGRIAYLTAQNAARGQKLAALFSRIDWGSPDRLTSES